MKALTDNPEQRRIWWDDFGGVAKTAVEEIVRYASPVIHFRRTATADTEIRGVPIAEGDKVVFWYCSANRDDEVFVDPYRSTCAASPNHQVGYGAGGPHFCLGANLARREITVMFEELRNRLPDLQITGRARPPPERLHPRHQAHAVRVGSPSLGGADVARSRDRHARRGAARCAPRDGSTSQVPGSC